MFAFALAASFVLACADGTSVARTPLDGLTQTATNDSNSTPGQPGAPTPGFFRGSVLGYSTVSGPDTMATAERVPDVRVTAYPRLSSSSNPPDVGPAAASVLTGANGEWQLPTLPGGEYVVTFHPPQASKYGGAWATAVVHANSHEYPWWVVLPAK